MNRAKKIEAALPQTRPPLERMLRIHQSIQAGAYPTAGRLAEELEVSAKSIHRDLEFMRSDRKGRAETVNLAYRPGGGECTRRKIVCPGHRRRARLAA